MRNGEYEYYDDSKAWPAFIVGALLGGGIALLLAPRTGTELRGLLRDYASKTKDEALVQGKAAWESAVDRGKAFYDKGEDAVREAGQSAREIKQAGKEALKEAS